MRRGGGHSKGSAFEREIARRLSVWWTGGVHDDIFWRTPGSGARATVRGKAGRNTREEGDLRAVGHLGQNLMQSIVVELKRGYKDWDLLDCVDSKQATPVLAGFLEKLQAMALALGRCPVLIAQRDRREPIIVMPRKVLFYLGTRFNASVSLFWYRPSAIEEIWSVVPLESFCDQVDPGPFLRRVIEIYGRKRRRVE